MSEKAKVKHPRGQHQVKQQCSRSREKRPGHTRANACMLSDRMRRARSSQPADLMIKKCMALTLVLVGMGKHDCVKECMRKLINTTNKQLATSRQRKFSVEQTAVVTQEDQAYIPAASALNSHLQPHSNSGMYNYFLLRLHDTSPTPNFACKALRLESLFSI